MCRCFATWRINEERARGIARGFAEAEDFVYKCELLDPQMKAVGDIVRRLGAKNGAAYVVGVALVSYMLSARGERHWFLAAEFAGEDVGESLLRFVRESPSLARFRVVRERRARRYLVFFVPRFLEKFEAYASDLRSFWVDLARAVGAKPQAKTVVFAVKMFYYSLRAAGFGVQGLPREIPIPVDFRVSLMSLISGLVAGEAADFRSEARLLRERGAGLVRRGWGLVSELSSVPALNMDAVLWLVGGAVDRSNFSRKKVFLELENVVGRSLEEREKRLVEELIWRL